MGSSFSSAATLLLFVQRGTKSSHILLAVRVLLNMLPCSRNAEKVGMRLHLLRVAALALITMTFGIAIYGSVAPLGPEGHQALSPDQPRNKRTGRYHKSSLHTLVWFLPV